MANDSHLRRTQAIAPFGIGAIHILKGTQAVVTGGLDFWYKSPHDGCGCEATSNQLECVKVTENRLQKQLNVSHFRFPPGPETEGENSPKLSIPLFRFPTWFVCGSCGVMRQERLTSSGIHSCINPKCRSEAMRQVQFAAACEAGHLQDFPWREWVHRDRTPKCSGQLFYSAGGSGSLDDIIISCDCKDKPKRNLSGVMGGGISDGDIPYTNLSRRLLSRKDGTGKGSHTDDLFLCVGGRVWLGETSEKGCPYPMKAVLINATNVHYAKVASALWIPSGDNQSNNENLLDAMDRLGPRSLIRVRKSMGDTAETITKDLLKKYNTIFSVFERDQIIRLLNPTDQNTEDEEAKEEAKEEANELELRLPEYEQLQKDHERKRTSDHLEIRTRDVSEARQWFTDRVSGIFQVDRLRETRAFYGFSRLMPQKPEGSQSYQRQLWRHFPNSKTDRWLPAAVVYGEGIFIRFDEDRVTKWEDEIEELGYLDSLQSRADASATAAKREPTIVSPRLVMLHTLSHLLIRRLAFECGYNSSSLRERLYANRDSEDPTKNMAGILIYTASGDCEGSLGGLVRMGEPERFEKIVHEAIRDASWCSSDPVCDEIGQSGGQGTDGLNLAACHCCTLLPETSCEQFNRFLDRGLIAGRTNQPDIGFFSGVI